MIQNLTIVGTGLIGASIGLALRESAPHITIFGVDSDPRERRTALARQAISFEAGDDACIASVIEKSDVVVLAIPIMGILDWMQRLAPILKTHQLLTDTGSTKLKTTTLAASLYNAPGQPRFLPGHPMAGKESGGAALADASLFKNATWLFTPIADSTSIEQEWRTLITGFGCQALDLDPTRHDRICAWVSHLPQMLSTALAAILEDEIGHDPESAKDFHAIGGRALREMTRLGASPYSMWRDVALTNSEPIATTIFALEQRLAHIRENLRTPLLREEFHSANDFLQRGKNSTS